MDTLASYKRNSYEFSDKELAAVRMLIDFFKYDIPDGVGSYLAMVDLDKTKFKWSPKMALSSAGVFGLWSWLDKDSIYIMPMKSSEGLAKAVSSKNYRPSSEEEKINAEAAVDFCNKAKSFRKWRNLAVDEDLIETVLFLCENEGTVLATVFHELYHKFQYVSSPFLYVINNGVTKLVGYSNAVNWAWTIEGDVRKYVDNESLWNPIKAFASIFRKTLSCYDTMAKYSQAVKEIEDNISELSEEAKQEAAVLYKRAYDENLLLKASPETRAAHKLAVKLIELACQ